MWQWWGQATAAVATATAAREIYIKKGQKRRSWWRWSRYSCSGDGGCGCSSSGGGCCCGGGCDDGGMM